MNAEPRPGGQNRPLVTPARWARPPGTAALVAGVVTAVATIAVAIISFTPADPPVWVRIGTFVTMLAGIPVSILLGLIARPGPGRLRGWVGVGLGLASALALVAMQMAVDLA